MSLTHCVTLCDTCVLVVCSRHHFNKIYSAASLSVAFAALLEMLNFSEMIHQSW